MSQNLGFTGADYYEAVKKHGSNLAAARALGVNESTVRRAVAAYKRREGLDSGIRAALQDTGLSVETAKFGWRRVKHDDGSFNTIWWKTPEDTPETAEEIADRIAERMNRVQPAPFVSRPKSTSAELRNFLPLFDVHLGMRIGNYGTAEAVQRIREGTRDVLERAPRSECTVILNGGDFTEANDNDALTPKNKHPLAVDLDYEDLADVAVDVTIEVIEAALQVSDTVLYHALRGNHDPATAIALRVALKQRYRENPRVQIGDGYHFFKHVWSGNMLAAIHGDAKVAKPQDVVLAVAARCAPEWGATKRRELWTGHLHSIKALDLPGMLYSRARAVCPIGRYARDNLFESESEIALMTYGAGGGRRATTIHIFSDHE